MIVCNSRNMGKKVNKNELFGHFCVLPVFLWHFGAVSNLTYYRKKELKMIIKHLMTDPKRNSELYVSPRPSMSIEVEKSLGLPWGRGEQNSLFPAGPVMECSVIPPSSKIEKKATKKSFALRRLALKFAAVSRNTTWLRASRKLLSSGISDFLFALCPGQTDRQVVAGGRKLNLRRDLRWVAKRTGKFSSQAHASRNKTISRQAYPVLHWLIIG